MKKKTLLCLLVSVCMVSITGCRPSVNSSQKEEYDLISKYFDIEEYAEDDGRIKENQTDKVLSFMTVDDTRFEIGMSYDDVLSLGYKPEEASFADQKPSGLAVLSEFINGTKSSVRLGFASFDSNATVSEGGYLYEINAYPESNKFSIDEISENSTILDIVDVFGNPYRIDVGFYSDFPDMKMEYKSREYSQYLTFYINLETEKIVSVHLEGYPE